MTTKYNDNVIQLFPNAPRRPIGKSEIVMWYSKAFITHAMNVVQVVLRYLGMFASRVFHAWWQLLERKPLTALIVLGFVFYMGHSEYQKLVEKPFGSATILHAAKK